MTNAFLKSFKHDGSSHRLWEYLYFIKEDDSFYYLGANRAKVIEDDGREWRAPEGALYILSKDRFYNIIVMFKHENDIEYYVNLASPTVKGNIENSYSFIDYDLDLKRLGDGYVKELDWGEYQVNSERYNYSPELKKVVELTLKEVKKEMIKKNSPFDDAVNYKMYLDFIDELNKSSK